MKCQSCVRVREDLISALCLGSRKEVLKKRQKPGLSAVSGGQSLEDSELPGLFIKVLFRLKSGEQAGDGQEQEQGAQSEEE